MGKGHNQITTDNVKIITGDKLLKLFSEGLEYQENKTTYYDRAKKSTNTGIKLSKA